MFFPLGSPVLPHPGVRNESVNLNHAGRWARLMDGRMRAVGCDCTVCELFKGPKSADEHRVWKSVCLNSAWSHHADDSDKRGGFECHVAGEHAREAESKSSVHFFNKITDKNIYLRFFFLQ